ncbi:ABC transporter substrate-binding protein [Marinilactibacillus sp. Marseille-P9653]|uniref:ABC transporter substrate-binding protein n=1 Tax=Marinilactibacillus sp. Marseille-P9653 TaxID=2866583 RepID=UPI001CE409EC|nr:ABC transporter substrate-binding protein [Marinilactibacillus sp. Marseille-P9653]
MKTLWTTSIVLSAGFMLAACGNSEVEAPEEETTETPTVDEAAQGPKTLVDGLGNEVEIPSNPENILGSYLEDYLVSLDITPVAQWSVYDGESIQDYLQDDLSGVPLIPHDLPYESVLEYEPDLMIVRDAIEQDMYEQYTQITPTYVLKSSPTEWRETLTEVGEVLGMEDKAESVLETYDAKAQEKAEELSTVAAGESAAAVWMVNNSLFVVHPERSSGAVMYGDLGLEIPEVVSSLSSDADWASISLEELAQMDVDHLFFVNSDGPEAELFEDRLWQNIPAVEQNQVYQFGPETSWLYYGPIASDQVLDNVVDSITK